jgi:NAD dependent epimerase/dehydratase
VTGQLGGREVLVTGAGGFIGSHLVERLVEDGASVRGLVRYSSQASLGALADLPAEAREQVELVHGDLRDSGCVESAAAGRDVIFHLGAEVAIPYSYRAPRAVVETNVVGTLNVLEAARRQQTPRLVCASTSEVYGNPASLPIAESHPLDTRSPYAASKAAADMLCLSFAHSYGLPVGIVRPFNTYGPRQSARAVIPAILIQALAGDEIRLGSLEPVRDFTYVDDTVSGLLAFAAWEQGDGRVVNLGSGSGVSIDELVGLIGDVLGKELRVLSDPSRQRPVKSEVLRLISDPAVAASELGWHSRVDLKEGLRSTAEWLQRNAGRFRADAYYT